MKFFQKSTPTESTVSYSPSSTNMSIKTTGSSKASSSPQLNSSRFIQKNPLYKQQFQNQYHQYYDQYQQQQQQQQYQKQKKKEKEKEKEKEKKVEWFRRICIIGKKRVGKTKICEMFSKGTFDEKHYPTITNKQYSRNIEINGCLYKTEIVDTFGLLKFQTEIPFCDNIFADGFVLLYSITDRNSFKMIKKINKLLIKSTYDETTPRILVANKSDLEEDRHVSRFEGEQLAKQIGCKFIECSVKKRKNIFLIFKQLLRQIDKDPLDLNNENQNNQCIIL